jgi:hypothetical protein
MHGVSREAKPAESRPDAGENEASRKRHAFLPLDYARDFVAGFVYLAVVSEKAPAIVRGT